MEHDRKRFRLGLFIVAAILLLGTMIVIFGGAPRRFFTSRNEYTIIFDEAPGVAPGTPVRKSGVRIGEVSSVRLDDATGKVHVVIKIDKNFTIRENEEPVIAQDLLSRDTTIDFVPKEPLSTSPPPAPGPLPDEPKLKPPAPAGSEPKLTPPQPAGEPKLEPPVPIRPASYFEEEQPPPANPPLGQPIPPGSTIQGRPSAASRQFFTQATELLPTIQQSLQAIRRSAQRFEQMLPEVEQAVREFTGLGRALREAVPEVRRTNDEVRALIESARTIGPALRKTNDELQLTLRNFSQAGESVNVLIQSNQDRIVKTLDQTTDVLQRMSTLLSDENQKNVTAILRATQAASTNFDAVVRNADELLREGQKTLANINQAVKPFSDRSERILQNLDSAVQQLNRVLGGVGESIAGGRGDGTLQKFLNDPSLYNNLNGAAIMVTRVIPRLDRILSDLEVFADKIARHPESLGVGGAVRPSAGLKDAPTLSPPQPYKQRP